MITVRDVLDTPGAADERAFAKFALQLGLLAGEWLQQGLDVKAKLNIYAEHHLDDTGHTYGISTENVEQKKYLDGQYVSIGEGANPASSDRTIDAETQEAEVSPVIRLFGQLCAEVVEPVARPVGWNYARFGILLHDNPEYAGMLQADVRLLGLRRDEYRVAKERIEFQAATHVGTGADDQPVLSYVASLTVQQMQTGDSISMWNVSQRQGNGMLLTGPADEAASLRPGGAKEETVLSLAHKAITLLRAV